MKNNYFIPLYTLAQKIISELSTDKRFSNIEFLRASKRVVFDVVINNETKHVSLKINRKSTTGKHTLTVSAVRGVIKKDTDSILTLGDISESIAGDRTFGLLYNQYNTVVCSFVVPYIAGGVADSLYPAAVALFNTTKTELIAKDSFIAVDQNKKDFQYSNVKCSLIDSEKSIYYASLS